MVCEQPQLEETKTVSETRRTFIARTLALAALCCASNARAEVTTDLQWSDLIPKDGRGTWPEGMPQIGVLQHGAQSAFPEQEDETAVTLRYNGKRVRLPGYLLPLEQQNWRITSALLVPFIGACIHVPSPPPNQVVFLQFATPYKPNRVFEPVYVSGVFDTKEMDLGIATVAYTLTTEEITAYGVDEGAVELENYDPVAQWRNRLR